MDPLIGLFALIITIFSGFVLLRKAKMFKEMDGLEVLIITFILGISSLLIPLLLVGVVLDSGFKIASWIILLLAAAFLIIGITKSSLTSFAKSARCFLFRCLHASGLDYLLIITVALFIFKYALILSIKGIYDWDATSLYLPFGRSIFLSNHIPIVGYYDYQPVTLPMGISVLYAWSYSLSNSAYSEGFRLFPILFVFMNMLIIFKLTREIASKEIAATSVIVYALLPLHDADLTYAAYYADPLYNTLILASFFFIYKYVKERKISYCLLGGLALGLAGIVKAQSLYLLPATLFVFTIILGNKRLRTVLTYTLSTLVALFFVFVVWPDRSFLLNLDPTTIALAALFVLALTTLVAICINGQANVLDWKNYGILRVLRDALGFYGIMGSIAGIWYLRNYLSTGSVLWGDFFNHADYHWATNFLSSTAATVNVTTIGLYLLYLIAIPFTSYVLGSLWVIPKIVGLIQGSKTRKWSFIMLVWVLGYWIGYFWSKFHEFEATTVDPRDLYPLASFSSIFIAFGIVHISTYLTKNYRNAVITILLFSFGFVSLSQSSLIYQYGPSSLRGFFAIIANLLGSTSESLAGKVPNYPRLLVSVAPSLLLLSFVISLFILGPMVMAKLSRNISKFRAKIAGSFHFHSRVSFKKMAMFIFFFSTIVVPYLWLPFEFSGGNIYNLGKDQLNPLYGGLFTELASYLENRTQDGDTILMLESNGLQYYLHKNVKVVALAVPGNLATFRSAIESNDSSQLISAMRKLNVRYVLLPKGNSALMEKLNEESLLFSVVHDPTCFVMIKDFNSWKLYELLEGRYLLIKGWEETSFTENWTYYRGNYTNFESSNNVLSISVPGNTTGVFQYSGMPNINTTTYPYLTIRIKGSPNTRYALRLISEHAEIGYDFSGPDALSENWAANTFNIAESPLEDKLLYSQTYLYVQSADLVTATLFVDLLMIFTYVPQ